MGSFRWAMDQAAGDGDHSYVVVDPGLAGSTVNVSTPLPVVDEPAFALTITGSGLILVGSPSADDGIEIAGASSLAITDLTIEDFPENGLRIAGSVGGGVIDGVTIRLNGESGLRMLDAGVVNITVRGCTIRENGDDGITLFNDTTGHVIADGNLLEANGTNGIRIGEDVQNVVVRTNNQIQGNDQVGVLLTDGARNNVIGPGNQIDANTLGGVQINGANTSDNQVTDNTSISDSIGGTGITIGGSAHDNEIVGNLISGNGDDGIWIEDGATDIRVLDNDLSGNADTGIRVGAGASFVRIHGNTVQVHLTGILVTASDDVWIGQPGRGNTVENNSVGIRASLSDRLTIRSNQVNANAGIGLQMENVADLDLGTAGAGNDVLGNGIGVYVLNGDTVAIVEAAIDQNGVGLRILGGEEIDVSDGSVDDSTGEGVVVSNVAGDVRLGPALSVQNNGDVGVTIDGGGAAATIDLDGLTVSGNGYHGILVQNADADVNLSSSLVENHTMGPEPGVFPSGLTISGAGAVVVGPDVLVRGNTYGVYVDGGVDSFDLVGNDGAACGGGAEDCGIRNNQLGLYAFDVFPLSVQSTRIADNGGNGVVAGFVDGTVADSTVAGNGATGILMLGATLAIDDSQIQNNGDWGISATFLSPTADLDDSDDTLSHLTLTDNDFGGNGAGGVDVVESVVDNLAAVRGPGNAGNSFNGDSPGFRSGWLGVVQTKTGLGANLNGATCTWLGFAPPISTTSEGGYCPATAGADPENLSFWQPVTQVEIDGGGNVIYDFSGANPHQVQVEYNGEVSTAVYSWDGDTTNDEDPAAGPFNFNDNGRFQAAAVALFFPPKVAFYEDSFQVKQSTWPVNTPLNIEVDSPELNQDPGVVEGVTAVVTAATSGDREVLPADKLKETDANSGVAQGVLVALAPDQIATVPGDGILVAGVGDRVWATYWNQYDPEVAKGVAVVEIVPPQTGGSFFFAGEFCGPQPNQVIGDELYVCIRDGDKNDDPGAAETITASATQLRVTGRDSEQENVAAVETGPNTGLFRVQIDTGRTVTPTPNDGKYQGQPGDHLVAIYTDPDDPNDTRVASGRFVNAPTPSTLRFKSPTNDSGGRTVISRLVPNQQLVFSVEDDNRNFNGDVVETLMAGSTTQAVTVDDATKSALIFAESFDAGGNRIDWIKLDLTETFGNTGLFERAIVTSDRFGADLVIEPNRALEVVAGGRVRATYVDADDPGYTDAFVSSEPCPDPSPFDCGTLEIPVEASFPAAVTIADRYGHPSAQIRLRGEGARLPAGSLLYAPSLAPADATVETLPAAAAALRNLNRRDRVVSETTQETAADSKLFFFRTDTIESDEIFRADNAIQGSLNDVLQLRYEPAGTQGSPSDWVYDTAVFCRNTPSFIEVLDEAGDPASPLLLNATYTVNLYDEDQNGNSSQREAVVVRAQGRALQDEESLTLVETGPDSAVFRAELRVSSRGEAVPGDGTITARAQDGVTLEYTDGDLIGNDGEFCSREDRTTVSLSTDTPDRTSELVYIDRRGRPVRRLGIGEPVRLRLTDPDQNLFPDRAETAEVSIFADPDRVGRPETGVPVNPLVLTETGTQTGVFEGELSFGSLGEGAFGPGAPTVTPTVGAWYSTAYRDPDDPDDRIVVSAPLLAAPLKVTVTTRPERGSVGDAVYVQVQVFNPNPIATDPAELLFQPFKGLGMTKDGIRFEGRQIDPPEGEPWTVPLGPVDAKETLTLAWLAGVSPAASGRLHAWGEVWSNQLNISERGTAEFRVMAEPVFTRSTLFLNVFDDANGNGTQEYNEPGLEDVRLVSGDGFSVRTDKHGQAHLANLEAGPNAVRLDPRSLPQGWQATTDERQYVELLEGMLHTMSFGVRRVTETVALKAGRVPWKRVRVEGLGQSVPMGGLLDAHELTFGRRTIPMAEPSLELGHEPGNAIFFDRMRERGTLLVRTDIAGDAEVKGWSLFLANGESGTRIRRWRSGGRPPAELVLPAQTVMNLMAPGKRYHLDLMIETDEGVAWAPTLEVNVYAEPPKQDVKLAANFGFNEAGLDPQTILALREAANLLREYPAATVLIEGFTDARGDAQRNEQLSKNRADKAKEYMTLVEGIDGARISTAGRGATEFVATNETEAGRAQNRRVEISVFGVPVDRRRRASPSVQADGGPIEVDPGKRFRFQGQIRDGVVRTEIVYPSGATFAARISVPTVDVAWQQDRVLTPPDYALPLTLTAPEGTTITGLGADPSEAQVMLAATTEVVVPMAGRNTLRLAFYPPDAPAVIWTGRAYLSDTRESPPGLEKLSADRFLVLNVPAKGARIRSGSWTVTGQTAPDAVISVNGRQVEADAEGRFAADVPVPRDERFELGVAATHPLGLQANLDRSYEVDDRRILAVGVAQLSTEFQRRSEAGDGGGYAETWDHRGYGRFYMEGELPGDVILKARVKTDNRPLETFLPDLLDYDGPAEDIIDPNRTYPVYGDASTAVDEAPGAGPVVLYLGWKGQVLEIGTLDIDERDSQIDNRVEITYGARAHMTTATGPTAATGATSLDVFGTRPESAYAQDRFATTGGLVYRLRHTDLQEGSIEVMVEEEDGVTGTRRTARRLKEGTDYTVDYLSGRIWILRPFSLVGPSDSIIRDDGLSSTSRWLVVAYRYTPDSPIDAAGHGEMVKQDFGRYGEGGVLYREEQSDGERERRGRAWVDVEPVTGTNLSFEMGRRWGTVQEHAQSLDGGLTFDVTDNVRDKPSNAFAGSGRSRIDTEVGDFTVEAYGRHLDAGYGSLRYAGANTRDAGGLGVQWEPTTDVAVGWQGNVDRNGDILVSEDRGRVQYPVGPVIVGNEARHQKTDRPGPDSSRTDVGARVTYPLPPHWTVYGEHQQEVARHNESPGDPLERRSTVGAAYAFNATWQTFLEVMEGNRQRGGRAGGAYSSTSQRVSLSYGLNQDIQSDALSGNMGAGAHQDVGERTRLSGAQEVRHGRERGLATILGADFQPVRQLTIGMEGERGKFEQGDTEIERRAVRGRVLGSLAGHRLEGRGGWSLGREARREVRGWSADTGWRANWTDDVETLVRFRYNKETSHPTEETLARYQEYAVGAAYRPVRHNRFQLLTMLRWAEELLSPVQDPSRTELTAIIASIDAAVRILQPLEVGWKLAGKRAGIDTAGFVSDPIHTALAAARLAWIFWEPFDVWGEYRVWRQWETTQTMHGPLVELGVRPADFVRFGMGYNFTQFDDELRPHDNFNAEGFRLRLQGLF